MHAQVYFFGMPKYFTLTVMLLLQCIHNGVAIKCFVCDSSDNPGCADLKSNSSIEPQNCTLDQMKSIDTWLFELNRFAYFKNGGYSSPLMYCQKVIARDPNTSKMVTARFCQLDTADTDACDILRSKLGIPDDSNVYNGNNNGATDKQSHGKGRDAEKEGQFHCSICRSDRCNGAEGQLRRNDMLLTGSTLAALAMAAVITRN